MSSFSKEERVIFEDVIEGFQDAIVLSKMMVVKQIDQTMSERASDTIWYPQPYVMQSFSGLDQTANFAGVTQLAVPARINQNRSVPWEMTITELRDAIQEKNITKGAEQKLASDINVAAMLVAANQGTLFVKRASAATGFDDIAACDAAMNEIGVQMDNRKATLSTRDYNSMASNLASRTLMAQSVTAYDRAFVGQVAGFDTFKLDYANRLTLAVPGAGVTINGANQRYVPKATSTATTGETNNVDNRYQTLNITVGAAGALKAGDAFTLPGINSVHLITKADTGQLKTFRIISITSGGGTVGNNVVVISPPIISADSSPTLAEQQYKNVTNKPSNGDALTFLNTVTGSVNPFWHGDAMWLLPGALPVPDGRGVDTMVAQTDQGIPVRMTKWFLGETMKPRFRLDTFFGVLNCQPEMTGVMMFSQT